MLVYVLSFSVEIFSKDCHPIPQAPQSSSLLALTMTLARDTYKIPNRRRVNQLFHRPIFTAGAYK